MFAQKPLGGKIRNGMRPGKDRNAGMENPLCLMPMRSQPTETFTGARNTKCLTYWEENGTHYFWKREWGSVKRFWVVSQHLLVSFFFPHQRGTATTAASSFGCWRIKGIQASKASGWGRVPVKMSFCLDPNQKIQHKPQGTRPIIEKSQLGRMVCQCIDKSNISSQPLDEPYKRGNALSVRWWANEVWFPGSLGKAPLCLLTWL